MAGRTTQRLEDKAYSLIGLLDISLAMIYGERDRAFIRPQEEIIKRSDDESIFAWHQDPPGDSWSYSGLLATSPSASANCQHISKTAGSSGFSLTGVGLTIKLPTLPYSRDTYKAVLHCKDNRFPRSKYGILVERLSSAVQFARVADVQTSVIHVDDVLLATSKDSVEREKRVRQKLEECPLDKEYGFYIRTLEFAWLREQGTPTNLQRSEACRYQDRFCTSTARILRHRRNRVCGTRA